MARLPEIEYNTPVQSSSGAYAGLEDAQKRAAATFETGLHSMGAELLKTEHNRAAADLLSGLESAQVDLRQNKTISTSQLRAELGADYDALPAEIKRQATKSVFNTATGQTEDQDREDIPMFAVAGHIFDARAKKLMADSATKFSSSGWAADFQDAAAKEVLQKKMNLSLHTMYDANEYFQAQAVSSAVDLANAGDYKGAMNVLNTSRTLNPKIKVEAESHVEKITQTRPLYEALRTGNIAEMARFLPALGDQKQFTKLNEEERVSFTHRFESEIKAFSDGLKRSAEEQMKATAENGWNGIFSKERTINTDGSRPAITLGDIPAPGTVKAEDQKSMIAYVNKINEGARPETDWKLWTGLVDMSKDRAKFAQMNLLQYRDRLADPEFKQLFEMQQGMKGGNPDAYDHFQTTDEAINLQLAAQPYGIDSHDKDNATRIGFVKTQIQHALATEQLRNGGKPLALEERDALIGRTIKATVDTRKDAWLGFVPFTGSAADVPSLKAGVNPTIAAMFQQAVTSLNPKEMGGSGSDRVKMLRTQYEDYGKYEPAIEKAWSLMRGKVIAPNDAVQVWYYLSKNRSRLEAGLSGSDEEKRRKVTALAIDELLRGAR